MKKKGVLVALILIAVGIILFAVASGAEDFNYSRLFCLNNQEKLYTVTEPFQRVEINLKDADLKLKLSNDGTASVFYDEKNGSNFTVFVSNGTLKIEYNQKAEWYDLISLLSGTSSVTVYLPGLNYEALKTVCSTGDMLAEGPLFFGKTEIKTSTGDVTLKSLNADSLDVSTSTGDIMVSNVKCGEKSKIKVSTGDVTLSNLFADKQITVESNTGDVRFENSDAELISVKTSTGDVSGTICTGKTFLVKTSTGKITIPDNIPGGKCEISTSTGDVFLELSDKS